LISNGVNQAQHEMQELLHQSSYIQSSYILLSCAFISAKPNHWRLNPFSKMLQKFLKLSDNIKKYVESAASSALELGVTLSVGLK